jgi:predicted acyltransferase
MQSTALPRVAVTNPPERFLAAGGRHAAVFHLGRRCLLLVLLGIFYYGGLANPWPGIRLTGVLQLIGVACFIGGSLYLGFPRNPRALTGATLLLLAGYSKRGAPHPKSSLPFTSVTPAN